MSAPPTPEDLARQLAVLEERMKTMQAEYKTDIARLAEDGAKRETRLILAVAVMLALAVAFLAYTDTRTAPPPPAAESAAAGT